MISIKEIVAIHEILIDHFGGMQGIRDFLAMFSQLFADIFRRKPMLITVFFGMGLSSLIMYLSQSTSQFIAGFFLLWVFFSSDIWVFVVSEESPKEKRARVFLNRNSGHFIRLENNEFCIWNNQCFYIKQCTFYCNILG